MAQQIMLRRQENALLFATVNTGQGAPIALMPAQAHFHEHQGLAVLANQIDFPPGDAVITLADHHPPVFQKSRRQRLGPGAVRGIFACSHRESFMTNNSTPLYVVPTPLGNLHDISPRAADILRQCPWIAAEDTRHSAPLLKHLGASGRLLPAHEHNEEAAAQRICDCLEQGEAVALISDAGTPAISDPGARIVARVRAAGHRVVPLPGPCAAVTALSASGLTDPHFLFYGFLPSKGGQRRQALESLAAHPWTLVFYEAPHRVLETVDDLSQVLGQDRTLVIARELTKLFESLHSLPLGEARAWLEADANRQKGEFVLLVCGAPPAADDMAEAERVLQLLLAEGLPVKQCAKLGSALTGINKNALYELALRLKG